MKAIAYGIIYTSKGGIYEDYIGAADSISSAIRISTSKPENQDKRNIGVKEYYQK